MASPRGSVGTRGTSPGTRQSRPAPLRPPGGRESKLVSASHGLALEVLC